MGSGRFQEYYSRAFDYVEIDSTFYRTPNFKMVRRWDAITPEHFRFTAKFPQVVTHDTRLGGGRDALEQFFQVMRSLERKLLCLLIQLLPSLTKEEGLPKLERLIPALWKNIVTLSKCATSFGSPRMYTSCLQRITSVRHRVSLPLFRHPRRN